MSFNVLAISIPFGSALYVLFSFLILLILISKYAYGPISKMIEARQNKIGEDLSNAENASKEAEKAKLASEEELKQTKIQASSIIDSARQSASQQADEIVANARERANVIQKQADNDAVKIKNDALLSAKNDVADISTDIATKLIGKNIDASDQQKLINQFIDEIVDSPVGATEQKRK